MAEKRPSKYTPPQGGMLQDWMKRMKLIMRLLTDNRVNMLAKVLPLAAVAYLISPVDLLPNAVFPIVGALDDAAVLWIGTTLFLEMCPKGVVNEHLQNIDGGDVLDASPSDVYRD